MKYILVLVIAILISGQTIGQTSAIDGFLQGKSVVLVSSAPGVEPLMPWDYLSVELHGALVESGGDPVAYFELEDVVLSEEIQSSYANSFLKRQIANVVLITRKPSAEIEIHLFPFTNDRNIVKEGDTWSAKSQNLEELKEKIKLIGQNRTSNNFLVLESPEFFHSPVFAGAAPPVEKFLRRNPLNLEVFKLGVPLSGSGGGASYLTSFRYDLLGKSEEAILSDQREEKEGLEQVFKEYYPYQVEFLTQAKSREDLIKERVQFILVRLEGRQGDLMDSMQVPKEDSLDASRIVVKYYIKFLVRDELYVGPKWDADPNWRIALSNFLKNLQNQP